MFFGNKPRKPTTFFEGLLVKLDKIVQWIVDSLSDLWKLLQREASDYKRAVLKTSKREFNRYVKEEATSFFLGGLSAYVKKKVELPPVLVKGFSLGHEKCFSDGGLRPIASLLTAATSICGKIAKNRHPLPMPL